MGRSAVEMDGLFPSAMKTYGTSRELHPDRDIIIGVFARNLP